MRSVLVLCLLSAAVPAMAATATADGAQLSATARALEAAERAPPPLLDPEPAPIAKTRQASSPAAEARRVIEPSTVASAAAAPGVAIGDAVDASPEMAKPRHMRKHRHVRHATRHPAPTRRWATASGGITIDVLDQLAPEQTGERLSLWLEGRRVAEFSLDDETRAVWSHIPLPAPGRLRYELRGIGDTEARGEHQLKGRGCVVIDHGRRYGIARRGAQLALLPIGPEPR